MRESYSYSHAARSGWPTRLSGVLVAAFVVALTLSPVPAYGHYDHDPHFQDAYCDEEGDYSMSSWSRSQARNYASIGVGEGYDWGGGCWNDNDSDDQYEPLHKMDVTTDGEGGDCSGFTFKSWALKKSASGYQFWPALYNVHGPYATGAFAAGTPDDVFVINKADAVYMDAFVQGGSHMGMIYTVGTSSGVDIIIEAKGEVPGTWIEQQSYRGLPAFKGIRRAGFSIDTEMTWFLRNSNTQGTADEEIIFADPAAIMVSGDWNRDGRSSPGTFKNGTWTLQSSDGTPDITFSFGSSGETPVTGDWNNDGKDTIGTVTSYGYWKLRNFNSGGSANYTAFYGIPGDTWVTGDWDGDGDDTIGLERNSRWLLRNFNSTGSANLDFYFGLASDSPVTGDWDGDGETTVGVVRGGGRWLLTDENETSTAAYDFWYGAPGDIWLTGDWDGDDDTTPDIVR